MSNYLGWFVLLLIGSMSTASAEMFVQSVKGNPTVWMDGYFKEQPIEVGMFIHPKMKVRVSSMDSFQIHCGDIKKPVKVVNTKQLSALCKQKKDPDTLRAETDSDYPIIISPRKSKVLALNEIEWGFPTASKFRLTITEFGDSREVIVNKEFNPAKIDKRYITQYYHLTEDQMSKIKKGRKYSVVIEDLSTNKSSARDPGFKGVVQVADKSEFGRIQNDLKKLKQTLDEDSLKDYFAAIYLRNQNYYADSTEALNKAYTSVNPVYLGYLRIKNAQSEGVVINYLFRKWFDLFAEAVKQNKAPTAALACVEMRANYSDLSPYWHNFLDKFKNRDKFKQYCNLTDL